MGDPSGIGPQILAKALSKPSIANLAEFVVIGDRWVLDKFNPPSPRFRRVVRRNFSEDGQNSNIKIVDLNNVPHKNFSFGKISKEYGRASIEYINKAIELIKNKEIDCLITLPISKEAINLAGFKWAGHSEYLAYKTKRKDIVMMLANRFIGVSLVTRHIPLEKVASYLDKHKIYKTIIITYQALKKWFGIKEPRIAVCGLNPHASDGGLIGDQERQIIIPAINMAKRTIKHIDGPLPSDTVFLKAKDKIYNSVIAMYHDQALIALKVLDFDSGINITLGLTFVRTSPLHGTAFDIAKTNLAKPNSLIEAIKTAIVCTQNLKRAS